jgi:hypothetical protein
MPVHHLTSPFPSSPPANRHCFRGFAYKECFFGVDKRVAEKTKRGFYVAHEKMRIHWKGTTAPVSRCSKIADKAL